jgi:hypothetical protein
MRILLILLLTSCATNIKCLKGKSKSENMKALRCNTDDGRIYLLRSNENLKLGNRLYVKEEEFDSFLKLKEKEENLEILKEKGIRGMIYKFNTIKLKEIERREKPVIKRLSHENS